MEVIWQLNKLKDYKLKFSGSSITIIYVLSLQQKNVYYNKKIVTIISKSLQ